jgi:hypothetical protein
MSRWLGTACLLAAAPAVSEAVAWADAVRSRVAVVRSPPGDRMLREAVTRVRAELAEAGFDVVEVDRAPGDERSGVEDAPRDGGAFATVAINRAAGEAFADVWISDHVTGKTVVRRVDVRVRPDATAVLAIRTLELLRASLLEIAAKPAPSEAPIAAPKDVVRWIEPALPALAPSPLMPGNALGLGAFTLRGLGGIGLAVGPAAVFVHGAGPWFVRVTLAGPLVGAEPSTSAGSATVRQSLAVGALGLTTEPRPLGLQVFVGAGGFDLHVSGTAGPPYRDVSGDAVCFVWEAGIGGLAQLGPRIALAADLTAMFMAPQPVVVIAGTDAGRAGAPSLGGSLGLLVGL